ncbi:MAG: hypothetical protein EA403_10050 [Spirochaetaceae bacterium]|nr:MAG: hypothetical protein EA403_10050 [Spirochaetaceae bacterium]
MRIALVFFPGKNRNRIVSTCKSLAAGIESQGHSVDLIDGSRDVNTKLSIYQYIVVGTEQTSLFGGKVSPKVSEFLKSAGMVTGKKCFAFVLRKPIGAPKALARLMKTMEAEGMFLREQAVISSPGEAEAFGKRLQI